MKVLHTIIGLITFYKNTIWPKNLKNIVIGDLRISLILFSAISILVLFNLHPANANCYLDFSVKQREKFESDCFRIGRLGSLKIAVPRQYILGPSFVYEGVDIWNPESFKNRPKQDSFDLQIDNFAIPVRLKNFKSLDTPEDVNDLRAFETSMDPNHLPDNQWVIIEYRKRPVVKEGETVSLFNGFLRMAVEDNSKRFIDLDEVDGLSHFISNVKPSTDTSIGNKNEVFFDKDGQDDIIICSNWLRRVKPYDLMYSCKHLFYDENKQYMVTVSRISDKNSYIPRWKYYKLKSMQLLNSFSVKN